MQGSRNSSGFSRTGHLRHIHSSIIANNAPRILASAESEDIGVGF